MCAQVLVAEDEETQASVLRWYLEADGHRVHVVTDGLQALARVRDDPPDLVVLDVLMPRLDGFAVCRAIRAGSDVPVLMLTARAAEDDLLHGLDLGADDYLTKPYSPRELTARVRMLLRRSGAGGLRWLHVDPAGQRVRVDGRDVECTGDEYAILAVMSARPGHVFSRAQLLEHTGGAARESTERAIDVHVKNLRRKVEPQPRRPVRLLTVRSAGYKLVDGG